MKTSRGWGRDDKIAKDDWETPDYLLKYASDLFGPFVLDAAASDDNAKCSMWYTEEIDGLKAPWVHKTWCNPPYKYKVAWIHKATEEMYNGVSSCLLLPAYTDVKIFHTHLWERPGVTVHFLPGRVKFIKAGITNTAPFGSMLCYFDSDYFNGPRQDTHEKAMSGLRTDT